MPFARGKGLLKGTILTSPPYFFSDFSEEWSSSVYPREWNTRRDVSVDWQAWRVQLLRAHSGFPFQELIGIFADISSLMRANVRRDEVPASVLDDTGIYLLISKREQQCQSVVRVLCVADEAPQSPGEMNVSPPVIHSFSAGFLLGSGNKFW